jgi:hypothetical protein
MLALPCASQRSPDIPASVTDTDSLHRAVTGSYRAPSYGVFHIADITNNDTNVPEHVYEMIRNAANARIVGDTSSRRPDLYGVFEDKLLFPYYMALYQTTERTYFGQLHHLHEVKGEFVSIPEYVSALMRLLVWRHKMLNLLSIRSLCAPVQGHFDSNLVPIASSTTSSGTASWRRRARDKRHSIESNEMCASCSYNWFLLSRIY